MNTKLSSAAKVQGQIMNTTEKGNKLEDELYDYLLDQRNRDELVFDAYPAELCDVHKKKKYYCGERGGDVQFDVVIEFRRKGRSDPHLFVIFECKNHQAPIQERDVTDFSDKVRRIFGHAAKGLVVSSSRLQSGAEGFARSRGLGIVKFDENGIDVVAERTGGNWAENRFVKTQIFADRRRSKSLKFSAYYEGRFFGSVYQLLRGFEPDQVGESEDSNGRHAPPVPYLPAAGIQGSAQESLNLIQYDNGAVDLKKLCAEMELELAFSERMIHDEYGNPILGSANFGKRSIEVNLHGNKHRERFTIAHEIGHFCLRHDQYLRSESLVEDDLFVDADTDVTFNYERLEYQANIFASELLLPDEIFRNEVQELRQNLEIHDKGFGYIFVDNQPCNYIPYNQLMSALSDYFQVSKKAIEIKLKRMALITDERGNSRRGSVRIGGHFADH